MRPLGKILDLLTPRERRQLYLLLPVVILAGLMEVAGVASIAPFLSVLTAPESIESNPLLARLHQATGVQSEQAFIFVLGLLVLVLLLLSNAAAALSQYGLYRFGFLRNHTISRRLLVRYLQQPFSYFLRHNSAELVNNVLLEVQQVITGIVVPGLQLLAKGVAASLIVALLILVDPLLALVMTVLLGGAYAGIYWTIRKRLNGFGAQRAEANRLRMKAANESIGGIRELKVLGREAELIAQYHEPSRSFALANAGANILGALPRYALEAVAFGGIIVILLLLIARGGTTSSIIPVVGLYAFGGYRLLPALQTVFRAMTQIRFSAAALDSVHGVLARIEAAPAGSRRSLRYREALEPLPFEKELRLQEVTFAYPGTDTPVLSDIELSIRPNSWVAFVGETGSGKSTLVDLILGLLEPEWGLITVDGKPLSAENLARWRRSIGYVPQSIYLTDDTVARNIAFGVPAGEVDMEAVVEAARVAQIHEFIEGLPQGYDTLVGERGVRLSGGQRQRLGIARALYRDPSILILDEATSALDNVTESNLFATLERIAEAKTVIMIAHRLSTVQECDVIHLLSRGRIVASGRYLELMTRSSEFRAFAEMKSGKPVMAVKSA